ncbi:MAG: hypothetical protein AB7P76_01565 [Candidatus Melainabacteria bacterium]
MSSPKQPELFPAHLKPSLGTIAAILLSVVVTLVLIVLPSSSAQALFNPTPDVIHLHSGQTVHGKITEVVGDIIHYKNTEGRLSSLSRLALTDRQDRVTTNRRHVYYGEVLYMTPSKLEIRTATGKVQVLRWLVDELVLGAAPLPGVAESSAANTAPVRFEGGDLPAHLQPQPEPGKPVVHFD